MSRLAIPAFVAAVLAIAFALPATASAAKVPLTIEVEGEGVIKCQVISHAPGVCASEYAEGTVLTLVPVPKVGSEFVGFEYAEGSAEVCMGETGPCTFTIEEESYVEALFEVTMLTLTIEVEGEGEVECQIDGGPPEPCEEEEEYPYGTEFTLSPEAYLGYEFAGFEHKTGSAAACTGSGSCMFTITENSSIEALFDVLHLVLKINRAGSGTVTSIPAGIECGSKCSAEYEEGEEVTLTAEPAPGFTFAGWSGCNSEAEGKCVVTLEEADATVTATFVANPPREEGPPGPPEVEELLLEEEGTAKAAPIASVKGGKAALRLTCSGGPCKGTLKLTAKIEQGGKKKSLVIGKASFGLADEASKTIMVKLSAPAKNLLAKGKALKAKATGTDLAASTVKLKPARK